MVLSRSQQLTGKSCTPNYRDKLSEPSGSDNLSITTSLSPGMELAVTVDTLVCGVHFPPDTAPVDIGHKALAVNISDLAAMGARPDWAVMSLVVPRWDEDWISAFHRGFNELAEQHGVRLMAWDIGVGPLAMTIQIHGQVPSGRALRRDCARPGDLIFVTGTLGDAGLALGTRFADEGEGFEIPEEDKAFIDRRLACPTPRVIEGIALRGIATAAIDISDGLTADLSHIVEASRACAEELGGLSATIDMEKLPLSLALQRLPDRIQAWQFALSSGDDYELCFTVPPDRYRRLQQVAERFPCPITHIGCMETDSEARPAIRFLGSASGEEAFLSRAGYRHFG
uniref:Thiamine-monophosphate kinase n=1 Tax=Candidatus Kentrum eta TaxID=2126337 RepID=A0A450V1J0_9GAMM|nr:MAG: thiamine-phosphate kinase [Candidatus Kentron sp. H]VFJ98865.1 MAG: thiamine-phosphate kinase [Candidatus Kentron sp. H]VFK03702.1 MAG: thiamine-phosphate kinase [Candidatus Kentron sp. H]